MDQVSVASDEAFDENDEPVADGETWFPEAEPAVDWYEIEQKQKRLKTRPHIRPSDFTAFAFRMPTQAGDGYEKFSFEGRRHMIRPYDTPARRLLLVAARQVEKSTLLGNRAITYSCLLTGFRTLYVSPSATQTKTFSTDRIKDPMEVSPVLRGFTTTALQQNVFEKQFVNRSKITLRYAFLNADRCAIGSTRVHFWDGSVATLEEINKKPEAYVGKNVWSVDPALGCIVAAPLEAVLDQGVREVYSVRVEGGATLVCTETQPLRTLAGWRPLSRLSVGDFVAVPRQAKHGVGNEIPVEEYRLIGYLLGDGNTITVQARLSNGSRAVHREFERCAQSLGAHTAPLKPDNKKHWVHSKTHVRRILGGEEGYGRRLRELNLVGKKHDTKRVPSDFFSGSAVQIRNLLGAIWATDGWASVTGNQYEVGYCSNSLGLLHDLRVLLLRFGIRAIVSRQKKPSTARALGAYTLSIRDVKSLRVFLEEIPVLGKEIEFARLSKAIAGTQGRDYRDRIPMSYAALRTYLASTYNLTTHTAWKKYKIQLRPGNTRDSIGRSVLAGVARKLQDAFLQQMVDTDVGWARIEEIVKAGEQPTFDLTIGRTENYLVDGLFIHNCRGIPATSLLIDEIQDILGDNIPIIEQCTSHAPENLKRFVYAGTPKSLDNIIEYYRSNLSTQGEWVVPCDNCGSKAGAGRYWNVLGEKNIGKKGLICEKCGKGINAQHDEAQWAFMVKQDPKKTPFESYRIPQLMVPWKSWDEILLDYTRYPRDKFYNEVLGISFDSGLRPLTRRQVLDCCSDEVQMNERVLKKYRQWAYGTPIFAGIDWGSGEHAYTVLTLGIYPPGSNKFRIFYIHRFVGEDVDPEAQLGKIIQMLRYFNVRVIGADYGGGYYPNDKLTRTFGHERVLRYQYMARTKKKVIWNAPHRRYMVHRTDVMTDIFNAIKRKQFEFPREEEFIDPYALDFLNIYSEYNESLRMLQYTHKPDKPDDSFHSVLYCFLASMVMRPRPDIIAPTREDPNRGPLQSGYTGTTNQG